MEALWPSRRRSHTVHSDAAEELGIKIRGLLGHDFAGGGDFHNLIDTARIEEERDLCPAGVDGVEGGSGFAFVSEMGFGGDRLRGDAQSGLENSFVEEDDVELALKPRNVGEKLGKVDALAKGEGVEGAFRRTVRDTNTASLGIGSGIDADGTFVAGALQAREKLLAHFRFLGVIRKRKLFGDKPGL